jgi:hypothetical protein
MLDDIIAALNYSLCDVTHGVSQPAVGQALRDVLAFVFTRTFTEPGEKGRTLKTWSAVRRSP